MPIVYEEQAPPADLRSWIASFWRIAGTVEPGRPVQHRILPDGCADIVFDLEVARHTSHPSGDLIGPASGPLLVTLEGRVEYLGVRCRPGVIGSWSGIPAHHLRDAQLAVADQVFPLALDGARLAFVPRDEQMALVIEACRRRTAALARPDPVVRRAILSLQERAPGGYRPVATVARDAALSERAFERRFMGQVGLTPVQFRRVARFRSVLRQHGAGTREWAALAALEGFSDQAHLAREFRYFSGLTPGEWARAQEIDAGFLQDSRVTTF